MSASKISQYGTLATPNATNMQSALQTYGPLSVAITVINSFYSYK
jgi:cathepsin K